MNSSIDFVLSFALFAAVLLYAFFYPIAFFSRADFTSQADAGVEILAMNAELKEINLTASHDYYNGNCNQGCTLHDSGYEIPKSIANKDPLYVSLYDYSDCKYRLIVDTNNDLWVSESISFDRSRKYSEGDTIAICGVIYSIDYISDSRIRISGNTGKLDPIYLNNIVNSSQEDFEREFSLQGSNFRILSYFENADFKTEGTPSGNIYSSEKIAIIGDEISKLVVEVWG